MEIERKRDKVEARGGKERMVRERTKRRNTDKEESEKEGVKAITHNKRPVPAQIHCALSHAGSCRKAHSTLLPV